MEELNTVLKKLEELCQQERNKKIKKRNLKVIKEEVNDNNGGIKMFLRARDKFLYKNNLRLKSARMAAPKKPISENFDEMYEEEQKKIFKKPWSKLNRVMKMNRLYRYLKIRKNELEWELEEYEEKLEFVKDKLDLNGLRKDVEYDEELGEVKNCWLIDDKPEEEKN